MFEGFKNIFNKLNIYNMPSQKRGQPIFAKDLNKTSDTIEEMGQAELPTEVPNELQAIRVKMFEFVRYEKDVSICHTFNGTTAGEDEIKVALPFVLRQTPFDSASDPTPALRDGIEYTYTFKNDDGSVRYDKRTSIIKVAGEEDDEEIQVITSPIYAGDIIFGMAGIFGGTGVFHDVGKTKPVIWQEFDSPREWANTSDDDEEDE